MDRRRSSDGGVDRQAPALKHRLKSRASRIPVLMYHRVGEIRDIAEMRYCISPERFAGHMRALAKSGWWACAIDDFAAWLEGGAGLPAGAFLLTFDDGFLGVYEHVLPVLRQLGWPATVFLVSTLLGSHDMWRRTESAEPHTYPLLGLPEISAMQRFGFAFHSHSRTHADLTRLGDEALHEEVAGSKTELEALLGESVAYMAYPFGRYEERVLRMTRAAGYRAAFSVDSGFNRPGMDAYRVRRIDVFGTDTPTRLLRKVSFGVNESSWAQSVRYYIGRLGARVGIPMRSD
jgi:peptidoglycan/xylan/chitin deacetylase (PgdA/CDA1 family)